MKRTILICTFAIVSSLSLQALAQGKKKKPWKGGRIKFKRAQGSAAQLKSRLESLMKLVKERPLRKKAGKGDGLSPPPKREKKDAETLAKQEKVILKTLRSMAPNKAAIKDAFKPSYQARMSKKLAPPAKKLFSGKVSAILKGLGIRRVYQEVQVFEASTEDLVTMDLGTVAAREFASGLRRTARMLRERYHWYVVLLKKPKAKIEAGRFLPGHGARLQLFFYHQKRYVLLGRIWRLDKVF